MTSEALWTAFSNGDDDAWAELLARHWNQTLQYTVCRVGDRTRVRLIVREVFRLIYRRRGRKIDAFQPWPFTLASRLSQPYWSEAFKAGVAEGDRVWAVLDAWEAEHGPASFDDLRRLTAA